MASNQTPHLKLCQWEADDEVLRADFNADNAKIDAAVAGVEQKLGTSVAEVEKKIQAAQAQAAEATQAAESRVAAETARAQAAEGRLRTAAGYFTGDGASEGKTIELGFAPAAVFAVYQGSRFVITGSVGSANTSALAVRGGPASSVTLTDTGFIVKGYLNTSGTVSTYVAWQ